MTRRPGRTTTATAVAALLVALLVAACAGPGGDRAAGPAADGEVGGRLTVLAAASLTDALERAAAGFEDEHPDTDVVLSFGGSSALVQQALSGAPADLLVVAAPEALAPLQAAGETDGNPVVVARNSLQLAVPAGNPGRVTGLADLADEDLAVALCAPQVPCGSAAAEALRAAGVTARPDTLERDVRAVLTKVRLGEVDAGLVYRTDVLAAAGDVEGLDLPSAAGVTSDYPAVVLAGAPNPVTARAFVAHLGGAEGREVLRAAGFEVP